MTTLVHRDLQDVLLITGRALECRDVDEMRRQVLDCLEIVFKADKSAFILADRHWLAVIFISLVFLYGLHKEFFLSTTYEAHGDYKNLLTQQAFG
jgi:hypothetical protein